MITSQLKKILKNQCDEKKSINSIILLYKKINPSNLNNKNVLTLRYFNLHHQNISFTKQSIFIFNVPPWVVIEISKNKPHKNIFLIPRKIFT